jgi:hypothetical protein
MALPLDKQPVVSENSANCTPVSLVQQLNGRTGIQQCFLGLSGISTAV